MLFFESDYTEGAHEKVLARLIETNLESHTGYGGDQYCSSAAELIKNACSCPNAEVRFITGGTQTNQLAIDTILHGYEGVIAADTGHINGHEGGAIEYSGHKVIALPNHNGKIAASDLQNYLENFFAGESFEHMAIPAMVYISHPTEYGTIYSKKELSSISEICHKYKLSLYLDGARLAYGLAADGADLTLQDIAELCDVFYIGGTKCGLLCGEALVFTKNNIPSHFLTSTKQHGALLAKGRLLGIQFETLFTDGLYYEIGSHAIEMAHKLKDVFLRHGYQLFIDSPTNQQFILLPNSDFATLRENVAFTQWEIPDKDHTVVRFATSWATTDKQISDLEELLSGKEV